MTQQDTHRPTARPTPGSAWLLAAAGALIGAGLALGQSDERQSAQGSSPQETQRMPDGSARAGEEQRPASGALSNLWNQVKPKDQPQPAAVPQPQQAMPQPGQPAPQPFDPAMQPAPAPAPTGEFVGFPAGFAEPVDLAALVDFIAERLGVNIFTDPALAGRMVKFNGPMQIRQAELLDLLSMLLEQQGFALTQERPGWYNIRAAGDVAVHPGDDAMATTRIIPTPGLRPSALQTAVAGAVKSSGAGVSPVPGGAPLGGMSGGGRITYADELGVILITDTPRNIRAVETIIELILAEQKKQSLHRFEIANITADIARAKIIELAGGGARSASQRINPNQQIGQPATPAAGGASGPLTNLPDRLIIDAESNALIFRGTPEETDQLQRLISVVDVPSRLMARRYVAGPAAPIVAQFGQKRGLGPVNSTTAASNNQQGGRNAGGFSINVNPQQGGFAFGQQQNQQAETGAGFFLEENQEAFVYFGTPAQHKQVAELVNEFGPLAQAAKVVVEFYKLKHANSEDIAELVSMIIGQDQQQQGNAPFLNTNQGGRGGGNTRTTGSGGRRSGLGSGAGSGSSSATGLGSSDTGLGSDTSGNRLGGSTTTTGGGTTVTTLGGGNSSSTTGGSTTGGGSRMGGGLRGGASSEGLSFTPAENVTIQADVARNQVIVKAPARQQQEIATIIQRLDVRRPQVLIEAKIVSVTTTQTFNFSIEGQFTPGQAVFFTNFGLTTAGAAPAGGGQAVQGARVVQPNLSGVTTAVIRSDYVPVVINALQTNGDTQILSSPQILVNDNEEAELVSLREEPYAQTVQGTSTTQTSQGGVAEAGTRLTVRPTISEAGLLNLEYGIELSNFLSTANQTSGLQPPKQKENYSSLVTLPSDATMVIGGLTTENFRKSVSKIPLLGDIPIIGELFRSTNDNKTQGTIFVFIRPVIIRDSSFGDLRLLTKGPLDAVRMEGDTPALQPAHIPVESGALMRAPEGDVTLTPARLQAAPSRRDEEEGEPR